MLHEIEESLRAHGFEKQKMIGQGGYSSIYLVKWNLYPDEIYVAKVTPVSDDKNVDTYANEIESLQKLECPNIIYVFKHFRVNHFDYIILEYCPNGNINDYVKKNGPLDYRTFVHAAKELLEALNTCHKNGFVHLDIKPENILIKDDFRLKLSDFGLAHHVNPNQQLCFNAGSRLYSAPERFTMHTFDPFKADVWSLGITFYIMIVGRYPFDTEPCKEIINNIIYQEAIFPLDVDQEVFELISSMLSKMPEERPTIEKLLTNGLFDQQENIKLNQNMMKGVMPLRISQSMQYMNIDKSNCNLLNTKRTGRFRKASFSIIHGLHPLKKVDGFRE